MDNLILNIVICSLIDVIVSIVVPEGGTRNLCLMVCGLYMFYSVLSGVLIMLKNIALF